MAKRSDEKLAGILEVSGCPKPCQNELRQLVEEGHSIHQMLGRLDEIKKRLAQIIIEEQGILSADGSTFGVRSGPHCVIVRQQEGRETLSKELLVENGVSPAQIAASTRRGSGFNVVEFGVITGD